MILVVDNRDSFTFNLAQVLQELGARVEVVRGAGLTLADALGRRPDGILIGPGPGTPTDAAPSEALAREAPHHVPVLGVCLGHQAIATAYGGRVAQALDVVHGEAREVLHDGRGVFEGLPSPLALARYNSLAVVDESFDGAALEVSARERDGTIAALRHRSLPLEGVQAHPESILCVDSGGRALLANFVARCALAARGR